MILINKVTPFANDAYQKDLFECLINNSEVSFISNIIVFYNNTNIVLPKNNKVNLVVKNGYTDKEIIEYCKRVYNDEVFIFSNPFIKFNNSLIHLEMLDNTPIRLDEDCFIFNKNINFENGDDINTILPIYKINNKLSIEKKQLWTKEIRETIVEKNSSKPRGNVERNARRKEVYLNRKNWSLSSNNNSKKIDAVVVSVDYNDFLEITLKNNINLVNVTVVTSKNDVICQEICKKYGANCVVTERMYEDGAIFNKGKAINEGIKSLKNPDWILLLDADIYLPSDFSEVLKQTEMITKNLIVCKRLILDNYELFLDYLDNKDVGRLERAKGFGYFQMFNIKKFPKNYKIFPENSDDASWSDLTFRDSFKDETELNTTVLHLGQTCQNWQGRKTPKFFNTSNKVFNLLDKLKFVEGTDYMAKYEKKSSLNKEPFIIHTSSIHNNGELDSNRRNQFAYNTWQKLYESSKIIPAIIYCKKESEEIPCIKDIFDYAYSLCESDDDIIMYTNSDICLTSDVYEKVSDSCKKWNCTFSFRKDFNFELIKEMTKEEVKLTRWSGGNETPTGADLFAVTKSWWENWRDYIPNDQVIGRPTWDWVFRITMGKSIEGDIVFSQTFEEQGAICETPNISYHETHNSYWDRPENLLDEDNIKNTRIAYYWMKEKSNNINFTGKEYFEKTYGENLTT
jgi:hypothetical protein